MMTATKEEPRNSIILSEEECSSVTLPDDKCHDDTKTALMEKPKKYWAGSNFLQAVNACDKLFNCGTFHVVAFVGGTLSSIMSHFDYRDCRFSYTHASYFSVTLL